MAGKLDDPNFGSAKPAEDPYKQNRASLAEKREERFQKQVARELKRGRLSENTKRQLAERQLSQFVSSTLSEKRSFLSSTNLSQSQKNLSIQSTRSETPDTSILRSGGIGGNKTYFIFTADICVDGEAKKIDLLSVSGPYGEE